MIGTDIHALAPDTARRIGRIARHGSASGGPPAWTPERPGDACVVLFHDNADCSAT
ncbi:hypothetical protein [Streptomyces macrosporus]|uniref:Uncharacterized protein n=1 Tax=Streptomyces macrosporus TaxID=44032 RepID=A0ABN3KL71_9ACTN